MKRRNTWLLLVVIILVALFCLRTYQSPRNTQSPHVLGVVNTANSPGAHDSDAQYPGATAPEAATAECHMRGVLPDPTCTPGVTNPDVTQGDIRQTICRSGYSKSIRPPASYTDQLKRQQMASYGFTDSLHQHEEDHLISLELGGSPSDPKNLWPEPHASPNAKDKIEDELHADVCDGRISLQDAQRRIAADWTTALSGM